MKIEEKRKYVEDFTKNKRHNISKFKGWLIRYFGYFYDTFIRNFIRSIVKKGLSERKELFDINYCMECGICCNANNCPAFDTKTKLCTIWGYTDYSCRVSPLFRYEIDINKDMRKYCRYYWEDD